jgi:hypothetical protein
MSETIRQAKQDYERMIQGERIITNRVRYDALIDHCGDMPRMDELASCRNAKRVGVQDENVAWIGNENKPEDLEFGVYQLSPSSSDQRPRHVYGFAKGSA